MNLDSYQRQIQTHQKEIARIQKEKSDTAAKIATINKKINTAVQAAGRAKSPAALKSKQQEIRRAQDELARIQKRLAGLENKLGIENRKLSDAQRHLTRAEEKELKDRLQKEERRLREQGQMQQNMENRLFHHDKLHEQALSAIDKLRELPERIVVLFLASNPLDQQQLRLDEEVRSIQEMIRKSKHRDAVQLESRWAVRPLDVLQALNELQPRIVHFSGHGSNNDEIVFQDNSGQAKLVPMEAIVQTMQASSDNIQLVFFNTCYSINQAKEVVKHVDVTVGMNTSIGDDAARVFSAQFYSAIGFGLSVHAAFEQAKAALMLENIPEHDTPELFVAEGIHADDLILVRPPELYT